ncbi:hypothetical protein LSH36_80g04009 [Paralvinella palmiformis]|uniref:Carbonic anhydrase n=1 Tax=Paralvinella palmiformis TaxID=53620 RepID=A0AAD9K1W9_9ANNE|nr:hypothetical protein LSH36_80g04009 [Paralvinella palmiformis]
MFIWKVFVVGIVAVGLAMGRGRGNDDVHTDSYDDDDDNDDARHQPHWSYHGKYSPDKWDKISKFCTGANPRQSPIDIEPMNTIFEDDLTRIELFEHYSKYRKLEVQNNGHTVNIGIEHEVFISGGDLPTKGYRLVGIHFHWGSTKKQGSEHTINSNRYPLEMHMVSYDSERYPDVKDAIFGENSIAVLGTIFQISDEDNPALTPLLTSMRTIDEPGTSITIGSFPIANLLPKHTDKYFRYEGSLTTPPCAESVIWTIFLHTQTISSSQLSEFRELVEGEDPDGITVFIEDNWRPVQPTHSRVIYRSFLFKSEYSKAVASQSSHGTGPGEIHNDATRPLINIMTSTVLLLAAVL